MIPSSHTVEFDDYDLLPSINHFILYLDRQLVWTVSSLLYEIGGRERVPAQAGRATQRKTQASSEHRERGAFAQRGKAGLLSLAE